MTAQEKLQNMQKEIEKAKPEYSRLEGMMESKKEQLKEFVGTSDPEEANSAISRMESRVSSSREQFDKEVEELYTKIDWGF